MNCYINKILHQLNLLVRNSVLTKSNTQNIKILDNLCIVHMIIELVMLMSYFINTDITAILYCLSLSSKQLLSKFMLLIILILPCT